MEINQNKTMTEAAEEETSFIPLTPENELKPKIPYMKHLIRASQLINMWPNVNNGNKLLYHLVVWVIAINCLLNVLSFGIRIIMDYRNMDGITEMVDIVTVLISGSFRYIYVYIRGGEYLQLVYMIHNNFIHYSFFQNKRTACLEKYYKMAIRVIIIYSTFTFSWVFQICFVPGLSYLWARTQGNNLHDHNLNTTGVNNIPYPVVMKVYVPFDIHVQPINALFYGYQVCSYLIFGVIYVAVDTFWYMVIFLAIGQLALIKDSLITLTEILHQVEESKEHEKLKESQIKELENGLKKCIQHHQFARSLVHKIEDINTPNILVDSLHAIISIGFILLEVTISLTTGAWSKVLTSFEYFVASVVHIFFFAWLGNELAEKEQELARTIYDIPWYLWPKQKPFFLLLTIQSMHPYRLTGGKMYRLSLQFFTSMMRAVFSYFTFLLQMRNGKHGIFPS